MTPTFDVDIDRYRYAVSTQIIATVKDVDDHTASVQERKKEKEASMEEETSIEARPGKWEPKRCALVSRALQLRKRRLHNKYYKKGGCFLVPERRAYDFYLRHAIIPHSNNQIESNNPMLPPNWARTCLHLAVARVQGFDSCFEK